jgi:3-phenylpropionate/cinnamic acid dioxygenase small subunit
MPVPDHVAIANLVYRYAELIDAGDFDAIGELFGDAVITAEGSDVSWRGSQAITEMYVDGTRRYPDGTPRTKHVTTNLVIEVDDARELATCRSYFTVLQQTDIVALQPIIAGRYHDEFRRAVHWSFARRHMIVDLVGDLSQHLLFEYRRPD